MITSTGSRSGVNRPIYDREINTTAWQIHNIAVMKDGTIYAGENDVPHRSSYLWGITGIISLGTA